MDKRILVIDDDRAVCATMKHILNRKGIKVYTAFSGSEALAIAAKQRFDLVITDLVMPEQDGVIVISKFKTLFPAIPVIAMSGGARLGTPETLASARQAGADGLLRKPFTVESLTAAVDAVVAGKARPILRG